MPWFCDNSGWKRSHLAAPRFFTSAKKAVDPLESTALFFDLAAIGHPTETASCQRLLLVADAWWVRVKEVTRSASGVVRVNVLWNLPATHHRILGDMGNGSSIRLGVLSA